MLSIAFRQIEHFLGDEAEDQLLGNGCKSRDGDFTEEALHVVRRIETLRTVHGLDLVWIKTIFDLLEEVERLRAEVRFLRDQ